MKVMKKYIFLMSCLTILLSSCGKEELPLYDNSFIHINYNNLSTVNVNSNRKDVVSYYIYLSSKPLKKDVLLDYSIIIGEGLKEGEDFKILTTEFPLAFPIGIYRRPIQIQWLDNVLDSTKDNTITIKLNSNNLDINIGFPGKDSNQSELIIQKINN